MYIILVYDVRKKRVQNVMKICRKYLNHLQNSVFEGHISEAKLNQLKMELKSSINVTEDAVSIFKIESTKYVSKDRIGVTPIFQHII